MVAGREGRCRRQTELQGHQRECPPRALWGSGTDYAEWPDQGSRRYRKQAHDRRATDFVVSPLRPPARRSSAARYLRMTQGHRSARKVRQVHRPHQRVYGAPPRRTGPRARNCQVGSRQLHRHPPNHQNRQPPTTDRRPPTADRQSPTNSRPIRPRDPTCQPAEEPTANKPRSGIHPPGRWCPDADRRCRDRWTTPNLCRRRPRGW